jgi:hypothetical protein
MKCSSFNSIIETSGFRGQESESFIKVVPSLTMIWDSPFIGRGTARSSSFSSPRACPQHIEKRNYPDDVIFREWCRFECVVTQEFYNSLSVYQDNPFSTFFRFPGELVYRETNLQRHSMCKYPDKIVYLDLWFILSENRSWPDFCAFGFNRYSESPCIFMKVPGVPCFPFRHRIGSFDRCQHSQARCWFETASMLTKFEMN